MQKNCKGSGLEEPNGEREKERYQAEEPNPSNNFNQIVVQTQKELMQTRFG